MTEASGSLARTLCRKHPTTATNALARILHKDHPKVYPTHDSARQAVRYHRGERNGGHGKSPSATPRKPALPDSASKRRNVVAVEGKTITLVLCDAHIPYHDNAALEAAIDGGEFYGADTVLLGGDWGDFYRCSHYERDPETRRLKEELQDNQDSLAYLRYRFPKARIIYRAGNHEHRLVAYMRYHAEELLGIADYQIPTLLHLDDHGIEYVDEYTPIRFGSHLTFLHGNEYGGGAGSPVSPARGLMLKAKSCGMCGHFHRSSEQVDRSIEGHQLATWSVGCLCDLHPEYASQNQWNHGHAIVETDAGGGFKVRNFRSQDGKVY